VCADNNLSISICSSQGLLQCCARHYTISAQTEHCKTLHGLCTSNLAASSTGLVPTFFKSSLMNAVIQRGYGGMCGLFSSLSQTSRQTIIIIRQCCLDTPALQVKDGMGQPSGLPKYILLILIIALQRFTHDWAPERNKEVKWPAAIDSALFSVPFVSDEVVSSVSNVSKV